MNLTQLQPQRPTIRLRADNGSVACPSSNIVGWGAAAAIVKSPHIEVTLLSDHTAACYCAAKGLFLASVLTTSDN